MKRILHVVESFGGGVATAVQQYAESAPEHEHHLLYALREGDFAEGKNLDEIFVSKSTLPRSPFRGIRAVREAVKLVEPDVIHAHSSWAGVFVRICCSASRGRPIVYTPHAFAFTRRDVSQVYKFFYRVVERLLAMNTTVFAACSPLESRLARKLAPSRRVVLVPNQSDDVLDLIVESEERSTQLVGGGRISIMKDPDFFIAVVKLVRKRLPSTSALWVGGGDEERVSRLHAANVMVTGWVEREKALQELSSGEVYVHTSRWEGMPLAVIESHRLGVPTVVREIDAFETVPEPLRGKSPQEVADKAARCLTDAAEREANLELWSSYLELNTRDGQAAALADAYSS